MESAKAQEAMLACTFFFQSSYLHSVDFWSHKFMYFPFDLILMVWVIPSTQSSKIREEAKAGYCSQFKAAVCPFLYIYQMHLLLLKFKSLYRGTMSKSCPDKNVHFKVSLGFLILPSNILMILVNRSLLQALAKSLTKVNCLYQESKCFKFFSSSLVKSAGKGLPRYRSHSRSLLRVERVASVTLPEMLNMDPILLINGQQVVFIYLQSSSCSSIFFCCSFCWFTQSSIMIFWSNFIGIG